MTCTAPRAAYDLPLVSLVRLARGSQDIAPPGIGPRVAYDGTGRVPTIRISNQDGELELVGADEIEHAADALESGRRMARRFGPPIPWTVWKARQEACL